MIGQFIIGLEKTAKDVNGYLFVRRKRSNQPKKTNKQQKAQRLWQG